MQRSRLNKQKRTIIPRANSRSGGQVGQFRSPFLDASPHLYIKGCPLVGPTDSPSRVFQIRYFLNKYPGVQRCVLKRIFELTCRTFRTCRTCLSSWAGLKHFYSHFRSGFTIIYGEKYAFLSLFTKASRTDQRTDGRTDQRTDTASYTDARTHLKMTPQQLVVSAILEINLTSTP